MPGSLAGSDTRGSDWTIEAGGLASIRARAFVSVRSQSVAPGSREPFSRAAPKKKSFFLSQGSREKHEKYGGFSSEVVE